ncbi:MAG: type II secretion system F family protein [bacterium]
MNKIKTKKKISITKLFTTEIGTNINRLQLFENIGVMLSANINIQRVLEDLIKVSKSKSEKAFLNNMLINLDNGIPFWKIIEESKILNRQALALIKIGEISGTLGKNLEVVLDQIRKDREFKAKIKSASLYPGIVFFLMIIVVNVIGIFILPRLSAVYSSFNTKLPLPTRVMIWLGNFMGHYGILFSTIFISSLLLIIYFLFIFRKTKFIGQAITLRFPGIGEMIKQVELSRLGLIFSNLVQSGISVPEAFSLLADSTEYVKYQKIYQILSAEIAAGKNFSAAFFIIENLDAYIPTYPRQMLINGFNTGTLAESAKKVGKIYEKKSEITLKNVEVIFEPILLLLVWVGVLFVALSVILPIYSLVGNITEMT